MRPSKRAKTDSLVQAAVEPKPSSPAPEPTQRLESFKIIAGSYEKLLYGLSASISRSDDALSISLKPIFAFPAHLSCIKTLASPSTFGKHLATGSSDEAIHIFSLARLKHVGTLHPHTGSITALVFPNAQCMLSASEDGTIALFHTREWVLGSVMKGHKGAVLSMAVHPEGRVLLSTGKDRTMRMWDLSRGKGVGSTKLGKEGELVRFSTTGTSFAVQSGSTIDVYTTDMTPLHTITHPSRIHDMTFLRSPNEDAQVDLLLVAAEDKKVTIYALPPIPPKAESPTSDESNGASSSKARASTSSSSKPSTNGASDAPKSRIVAYLAGHTNRVKSIQTICVPVPPHPTSTSSTTAPSPTTSTTTPPTPTPTVTIAATASSDGFIRVYDLSPLSRNAAREEEHGAALIPIDLEPLASYDTKKTRLTCLVLAPPYAGGAAANAGATEVKIQKVKAKNEEAKANGKGKRARVEVDDGESKRKGARVEGTPGGDGVGKANGVQSNSKRKRGEVVVEEEEEEKDGDEEEEEWGGIQNDEQREGKLQVEEYEEEEEEWGGIDP